MSASRYTFWVLILVVAIAGLSQGLSIPLLAVLLEQQGISSLVNGLNAAALYIGMVLISPFMEIPLRKLGYRTTIICGLVLVTIATALIPLFSHLAVWFVLRFLMGVGDSALHYSSQMWVTKISSPETRGRDLSAYGLAYGVGFSAGPLGLNLLPLGLWVPFGMLLILYAVGFFLLARMKNDYPEVIIQTEKKENKYATVLRIGWLALIPSFLYGFMETSLNGSFPVYALRTGISLEWVSIILPSFVVGSILLQMPLGTLSDRLGRKRVMTVCAIIGGIAFFLFPLSGENVWFMMLLLAIAGAAVGSFYSLGLAFAADILPASMVPTAGIIAAINFGTASILAPNVNGVLMEWWEPWTIFWLMGASLLVFAAACLAASRGTAQKQQVPLPLEK
ncbi:MFS transporter [Brevibacillus centrosporus]|uniref:MFS transporter n=1 Tax=Brevibacillus centrosporus TaxID=54910 RepID=UPI000F0A36A9|nr:MFS transporter [Brevibacillus centrosporus]MEC2131741.1 MFS transporter [Brevibacillus centrosporus]RNB67387.1 MFS transporter [Brevibacillus centrosporus]GED34394.1 putative MFS-type transporter YfkF [Brevibacillus centrosporus]